MLLVTLLLSLAFAQTYDQCNEHFADVEDARACCQAKSMDLCTNGQVHQVVFGTDGVTQMCFSAFMADGSVGWWNADPAFCSGYGFKSYRDASGPGAHCCTDAVADTTPITCQAAGPGACTGTRILLDTSLELYCPDGSCSDEFCCQDFTPASLYRSVGGQYDYADADAATAACEGIHPDLGLCTKTQILGVFAAGYGEDVCSSGWHWDDQVDAMGRGWYVSDNAGETGFCGGRPGWRTWAPASGEGSVHCCVSSYMNGGYGSLGDLSGQSDEERTQVGRDYCEASSYPYVLCTQRELFQVAYTGEAENICMSGRLENPLAEDAGDSICGWEQVSTDCGNGSTGWKGWCPNNAGAHCCLDYVTSWYPDYTKDATGYDMHPAEYWDSDFGSLAAATTFCTDNGYEGICTVEQVKYVSENQADFPENQGCRVGWATDNGAATSGYWGIACGRDDAWYDAWQPPAGQNPVAHCCDAAVPSSSRAPPVLDPLVKASGWYEFSDVSQTTDACDVSNGYALCTRDQVETVATVGVARTDGSVQLESNLCYQAFMADGSKGWYQADATCGNGLTGWRFFNGNADAYCCLDFETELGTDPPTKAPAVPVYAFIGEYAYETPEEAEAACEATNSAYVLCNDDEVYTIATVGQLVDVEGFEGLEANQDCKSGWVEPNPQEPDYTVGWFQSSPTCGGGRKYGQWNGWALVDAESSSGLKAGAHCCVASLIESLDHPVVPETTEGPDPTDPVTETPATEAPTDPATEAPTDPATVAPTDAPETTTTTEYVRYSDLPSTEQEPEGCVRRDDLTPAGFEGVVVYCATEDLIYVNGRSTCVATSDPDARALIANAFENDWYFAQDGETCADKTYDVATDDQLYVTNHMLNNLEEDIDQLEEDMAGESADLDAYLANWKTEVAALISESMANFDETTQAALQNYIDTNLGAED